MNKCEKCALTIEPYFDAVKDRFASYSPEPGKRLTKVDSVVYVVEPSVHDSPRHFAACREDGGLILLAPEVVDLDLETFLAITGHEFGHACDFLYPAQWVTNGDSTAKAIWIGARSDKRARQWFGIWNSRSRHQVEVAADSIARTVLGKPIHYCGECNVQCFRGTKKREEIIK
jgi:hypothetical protein